MRTIHLPFLILFYCPLFVFAQDNDNQILKQQFSNISNHQNLTTPPLQNIVPLSGTYTIGGTSPDFQSFSLAATALSMQGVNGPVEFIVNPGLYYEQVVFDPIPGASAQNPIVFHSVNYDSISVTISFVSSASDINNFTVRINGADFITFSFLTFERSGNALNSTVIEIDNGSDNITFTNNRFLGATAVTTVNTDGSRSCIYAPSSISNNNLLIINNYFKDNANGIWVYGSSVQFATGLQILNNIFENFYVGLFILNQEAPLILNNTISRNNISSTVDYYGISLRNCSGELKVSKNKITAFTGSYGLRLRECIATSTVNGIISNNFIQVGKLTQGYGITVEDNCIAQRIINNSVHYDGTGVNGRAFYAIGATTSAIQLMNNIFANTGGGFSLYVAANATNGITVSDYNCLFTTGTVLAFWGSNVNSLTLLQSASGKDVHSVSGNPLFASANDLHVSAAFLDNAGIPLTEVPDDIDGDIRNLITPDIGADEFTATGIRSNLPLALISIFPNPFNNHIIIETPIELSSCAELKIYNLSGECMFQKKIPFATMNTKTTINVNTLADGVYVIELINNEIFTQKKLIKISSAN